MEHTRHIRRAVLLLLLLGGGAILARHFLIPPSFGEMGFYRYDSVFEFIAKEPRHGAPGACAECHPEVAEAKALGGHAAVACEVCHAPLATHVTMGEKTADMAIDRSWTLCAYCHQRLRARPADFVQIDLHEHLDLAPGSSIPPQACLECHDTEGIHSP